MGKKKRRQVKNSFNIYFKGFFLIDKINRDTFTNFISMTCHYKLQFLKTSVIVNKV